MTTQHRPQSVTLGLGSRQPVTIDDPRLVTLFWKLWQLSPELAEMLTGRITVHVGRGPENIDIELTKRV